MTNGRQNCLNINKKSENWISTLKSRNNSFLVGHYCIIVHTYMVIFAFELVIIFQEIHAFWKIFRLICLKPSNKKGKNKKLP